MDSETKFIVGFFLVILGFIGALAYSDYQRAQMCKAALGANNTTVAQQVCK